MQENVVARQLHTTSRTVRLWASSRRVVASEDRRIERGGRQSGCVKRYSLRAVAFEQERGGDEEEHNQLHLTVHIDEGGHRLDRVDLVAS